jgi:small ubiquitin-related modifier
MSGNNNRTDDDTSRGEISDALASPDPRNKDDDGKLPITLKVKDQAGSETVFKIRASNKFLKVMKKFAEIRGVDAAHVRFMYDGVRIDPEDTPKMHEMHDGDQIDAFALQTGGLAIAAA